jgi:hypothetical protein
MKLQGPYAGGDPRIDDFKQWNWGGIGIGLDQALASKAAAGIAAVIWDEITREIESRPDQRPGPYISTLGDDEPHLTVFILDTHCIIIPLREIEFDSDCMVILKQRGEAETDIPATLAMLEKVRAIFQGWIDQVDMLAAEVKEEGRSS